MKFIWFAYILLAAITVSGCEKVDLSNITGKPPVPAFTGGNDDDDPIIQGFVKDGDSIAIVNADVSLFHEGQNVIEDKTITDSQGYFYMQVDSGTYYLEVNASGYSTFYSEPFVLGSGSTVWITLE